jgi:hypothetical protein
MKKKTAFSCYDFNFAALLQSVVGMKKKTAFSCYDLISQLCCSQWLA